MNPLGRIVLGSFWTTVSLLTATGEWVLACVLLGAPASPWLHVAGLAGLFALNRAACSWYETEPHHGPWRNAVGHRLLMAGMLSATALGALGLSMGIRFGLAQLGGHPAEAGPLALAPTVPAGFDVLAAVLVTLATGLVLHGYTHGYRHLHVTQLEVPVAGLGAGLDGLRIAHVSDLHMGPLCDRAALRHAFAETMAQGADLICVTGDLVDSRHADLDRWVPELRALSAPLGVIAILGNHDFNAGLGRVTDAVRRHTDWCLLRDAVTTVERDGARLHVAGLDHRNLGEAVDALPALVARIPDDAPAVLLFHHPGTIESPAAERVALVLAGHTHGGQLAVPGMPRWNMARLLMTRWDVGTFRRGSTVMHVCRGFGTSGQRLRIGAPREITVVTLRAA